MKNITIYGELEPYPSINTNKDKYEHHNQSETDTDHINRMMQKQKQKQKNISIVIRHPIKWMVDRCPNGVGYWIQSKLAWYYLKQPDTALRNLSTARSVTNIAYTFTNSANASKIPTSISMEDLFLPYRALLGLFANIVDMLGEQNDVQELRNDEIIHTANSHVNYSPEECHEQLTATDELVSLLNRDNRYNDPSNTEYKGQEISFSNFLNKEPFDIWFLKQEGSSFVKKHLQRNIFSDLHINCKFLQGLRKMDKNYKLAKRNGEKWAMLQPQNALNDEFTKYNDYYRQLADAAERRSQRLPWGEQINPKNNTMKITRLYKIIGEGNVDLTLLNCWQKEQLEMAGRRKSLDNECDGLLSLEKTILLPIPAINCENDHDKNNLPQNIHSATKKRKSQLIENLKPPGSQTKKLLVESINIDGKNTENNTVTFDEAWEAVEQVKCSLDLVQQYANSRMSKTLNSRALIGLRNLVKLNNSLDSIKEFIEDCDEIETRNQSDGK